MPLQFTVKNIDIECIIYVPEEGKEHQVCSTQWCKLTRSGFNLTRVKARDEVMKSSNHIALCFVLRNSYATSICSDKALNSVPGWSNVLFLFILILAPDTKAQIIMESWSDKMHTFLPFKKVVVVESYFENIISLQSWFPTSKPNQTRIKPK